MLTERRHVLSLVATVAILLGLTWYGLPLGTAIALPSTAASGALVAAPAPSSQDAPGGPGAPLAKRVVVGMDTAINLHISFDDWER
jgi:hypothetical protein